MWRSILSSLCVVALAAQQKDDAARPDPAREFFAKGPVVRVELTLEAADREKLRKEPRAYVPATVRIDGGAPWAKVGVKLKGAAGSFREVDDHPGFTVHLAKFGGTESLHGLVRFHLNNGAQDDSRLSEWLGNEVFSAANLPAPRVAHARVSLDGAELGLYVLREAFDGRFLQRTFGNTNGNLYDGGFCQDVDQDLEKDSGDGSDGHEDLHRLRALCEGVDRERATPLSRAIDVDAFLDFCALEALLGHWDGYSQNRNNYRLWCPTNGRVQFLPHGMDQLLGEAEASVLEYPTAIVASAVMQQPAFRKKYRERLKALLPLLDPKKLGPRIDTKGEQLAKVMQPFDRDAAQHLEEAAHDLVQRLESRYAFLVEQVRAPEPKPMQFTGDKPIALRKWRPAAETDEIVLSKKAHESSPSLFIACGKRGDEPRHGAWRTTVLLAQGTYRVTARARCEKVTAPSKEAGGEEHGGVTVRGGDGASTRIVGDSDWRTITCEFEVTEFQRSVELSLDLRAMTGKAWFRTDSLQLSRVAK